MLALLQSTLPISTLMCQFPFPVPYYTVGPVHPPLGYPSPPPPPPQGQFPPHQGESIPPRATCELWTRPVLSSHTVVSADSPGVYGEWIV